MFYTYFSQLFTCLHVINYHSSLFNKVSDYCCPKHFWKPWVSTELSWTILFQRGITESESEPLHIMSMITKSDLPPWPCNIKSLSTGYLHVSRSSFSRGFITQYTKKYRSVNLLGKYRRNCAHFAFRTWQGIWSYITRKFTIYGMFIMDLGRLFQLRYQNLTFVGLCHMTSLSPNQPLKLLFF